MGFLQNHNLTLGSSQPEITMWVSPPKSSLDVNTAIIVLGVMTFALQLSFALFFMLRFLSYDSRVEEALRHTDTVKLWAGPSTCPPDVHKHSSYQLCDEPPSYLFAVADGSEHEEHEAATSSQFATLIPWDLVQN